MRFWLVYRVIDIKVLERIIRKYWKHIEQFLFDANYESPVFIRHFRDIIFPEFKLVYFPFFDRFLTQFFLSVFGSAGIGFRKAVKFI